MAISEISGSPFTSHHGTELKWREETSIGRQLVSLGIPKNGRHLFWLNHARFLSLYASTLPDEVVRGWFMEADRYLSGHYLRLPAITTANMVAKREQETPRSPVRQMITAELIRRCAY